MKLILTCIIILTVIVLTGLGLIYRAQESNNKTDDAIIERFDACVRQRVDQMAEEARRNHEQTDAHSDEDYRYDAKSLCMPRYDEHSVRLLSHR